MINATIINQGLPPNRPVVTLSELPQLMLDHGVLQLDANPEIGQAPSSLNGIRTRSRVVSYN